MSNRGQTILICALMPEAAPIIDALELQEGPKFGVMRTFGQDSQTPLCVSGIGGLASATAVGLARAQVSADSQPSFLNVGVSGHQSLAVGQAWMAHQVFDQAQPERPLYPGFAHRPHLPCDTLHSRGGIERSFAQPGGYDMEGYGFLQSALCFTGAEQCSLIKVVSDGPSAHRDHRSFKLDAKKARQLIADAMDPILAQINHLTQLSQSMRERQAPPPQLEEILAQTRFSQAQSHRLRRLLQQWQARYPEKALDPDLFCEGAQAGLEDLHEQLCAYLPLRPPK